MCMHSEAAHVHIKSKLNTISALRSKVRNVSL